MDNFRIAAKGFIVDENDNLLVLKREKNDVHMPEIWEIPGGRLDPGENPFEGMKREAREEIGIEVEVKEPISVKHFTRQDGQVVTMIIFLCKPLSKDVKISEEHEEFKWIDLNSENEKLISYLGHDAFFLNEVEAYRKLFMRK